MLHVNPDAAEKLARLADGVHLNPRVVDLLQIASPRRSDGEVAAALGTAKRADGAGERSRDHPADRVLVRQRGPYPAADRVQLLGPNQVHVGGDLEDRVLARVHDQLASLEVAGAELLDRLDAVAGAVADHPAAARGRDELDHLGREPFRVGGQGAGRHDAHQLPVAGGGVLARPQRMELAVQYGARRRRDSLQRQDRAQPEASEGRQAQSPHLACQVGQGVGAAVAIRVGVGQLAYAARVEHDHECAAAHRQILSMGRRMCRPTGRACSASRMTRAPRVKARQDADRAASPSGAHVRRPINPPHPSSRAAPAARSRPRPRN